LHFAGSVNGLEGVLSAIACYQELAALICCLCGQAQPSVGAQMAQPEDASKIAKSLISRMLNLDQQFS